MNPTFLRPCIYRNAINWLLIAALLLLTLVPFHYHLHHAALDTLAAYDHHVIDMHIIGDDHPADHYQDSHTLDPASDYVFKSNGVQRLLLAIALTLYVFLPLQAQVFLKRLLAQTERLPRVNRRNIPPLRAPPRF